MTHRLSKSALTLVMGLAILLPLSWNCGVEEGTVSRFKIELCECDNGNVERFSQDDWMVLLGYRTYEDARGTNHMLTPQIVVASNSVPPFGIPEHDGGSASTRGGSETSLEFIRKRNELNWLSEDWSLNKEFRGLVRAIGNSRCKTAPSKMRTYIVGGGPMNDDDIAVGNLTDLSKRLDLDIRKGEIRAGKRIHVKFACGGTRVDLPCLDVDGDGKCDDRDPCSDLEACNYDDPDAFRCLYEDAIGVCGGACLLDEDGDGICDELDPCEGDRDECGVCGGPGAIYECGCKDMPEGDCDCEGNQLDALGICGGECLADADGDGICDDVDDCAGIRDECGVCDGPGAIYECGCKGISAGRCDCDGNRRDALGVCGGDCASDADGDGICDNKDNCVDRSACNYNSRSNGKCEFKDECGICGGSGIADGKCDCDGNVRDAIGVCGGDCKFDLDGDGICDAPDSDGDGVGDDKDGCPLSPAQNRFGNGCPMKITHNNNSANFIIEGVKGSQRVDYIIRNKRGDERKGRCSNPNVFPEDKAEANGILNSIGKDGDGCTNLNITIQIMSNAGSVLFEEEFSGLDLICLSEGDCGFFKQGEIFQFND